MLSTTAPTPTAAPAPPVAIPAPPSPEPGRRSPRPIADLSNLAIGLDPDATEIEIVAWSDPEHDEHAHDPRSPYVERFWLGVIGPSCTCLLRLLAYGFDASPGGFALPLHDTARALGMGDRLGRSSPFVKALGRLCQFDLAAGLPEGSLAVRTRLPWLSRRMITSLPRTLREEHRQWEIASGGMPARAPLVTTPLPGSDQASTLAAHRQRAAQLALSVAQTGEDVDGVERALARWRFHPALARHLAEWAVGWVTQQGADPSPAPLP